MQCAHQVILRGGERGQADAATVKTLLGGGGSLLPALPKLGRLLPCGPRAVHRHRRASLVLMILGDALLQIQSCPRHGST